MFLHHKRKKKRPIHQPICSSPQPGRAPSPLVQNTLLVFPFLLFTMLRKSLALRRNPNSSLSVTVLREHPYGRGIDHTRVVEIIDPIEDWEEEELHLPSSASSPSEDAEDTTITSEPYAQPDSQMDADDDENDAIPAFDGASVCSSPSSPSIVFTDSEDEPNDDNNNGGGDDQSTHPSPYLPASFAEAHQIMRSLLYDPQQEETFQRLSYICHAFLLDEACLQHLPERHHFETRLRYLAMAPRRSRYFALWTLLKQLAIDFAGPTSPFLPRQMESLEDRFFVALNEQYHRIVTATQNDKRRRIPKYQKLVPECLGIINEALATIWNTYHSAPFKAPDVYLFCANASQRSALLDFKTEMPHDFLSRLHSTYTSFKATKIPMPQPMTNLILRAPAGVLLYEVLTHTSLELIRRGLLNASTTWQFFSVFQTALGFLSPFYTQKHEREVFAIILDWYKFYVFSVYAVRGRVEDTSIQGGNSINPFPPKKRLKYDQNALLQQVGYYQKVLVTNYRTQATGHVTDRECANNEHLIYHILLDLIILMALSETKDGILETQRIRGTDRNENSSSSSSPEHDRTTRFRAEPAPAQETTGAALWKNIDPSVFQSRSRKLLEQQQQQTTPQTQGSSTKTPPFHSQILLFRPHIPYEQVQYASGVEALRIPPTPRGVDTSNETDDKTLWTWAIADPPARLPWLIHRLFCSSEQKRGRELTHASPLLKSNVVRTLLSVDNNMKMRTQNILPMSEIVRRTPGALEFVSCPDSRPQAQKNGSRSLGVAQRLRLSNPLLTAPPFLDLCTTLYW